MPKVDSNWAAGSKSSLPEMCAGVVSTGSGSGAASSTATAPLPLPSAARLEPSAGVG